MIWTNCGRKLPNELRFDRSGTAAAFYRGLNSIRRVSLDVALDDIRSNPQPDGELIISLLMAPVVIYYYENSEFKISYSLSYMPNDGHWRTTVLSIAVIPPR